MKRPAHLAPLPPVVEAKESARELHEWVDFAFGMDGPFAKAFPGYQPRAGQIEFAHAVVDGIADGVCVLAEAGTGCHAAGQLILMHDGRRQRVEDILEGQRLAGPDGKPRRVLRIVQGEDELVEIVPVKGEPWKVNLDHILTLVRTNREARGAKTRRDCKDGEIVDVSVREWLTWSKKKKHLYKLFRRPCDFYLIQPPIKIEPYHLGLLLGDGLLGPSVNICKVDKEIEAEARKLAQTFGLNLRVEREATRGTYHLAAIPGKKNFLFAELKRLKLWMKRSGEKFIPERYLIGHQWERWEILAGLIDTDGSKTSGGYEYVSKSPRLADDVAFVARSLGLAAYVTKTRKRWQNGIGDYYRVSISGDFSELPLRLERKKVSPRAQKKNVLRTGFTVRRTGERGKYYGFALDGDGRFLLGDFTVTHNTGKSFGSLAPVVRSLKNRGGKAVYVTANIALQEQIVRKDLPTLKKLFQENFSFALAKGFSNYVCLDRRDENVDRLANGELKLPVLRDVEEFQKIFEWRTSTGDFSDLDFEPSAYVRSLVSISSEDCIGKKCPHWASGCYPRQARKAFQDASIIVTNYHLYFLDLELRRRGAPGILPQHRILIMDEFHAAAEIARSYLGERISEGSVKTAVEGLDASGSRAEKLELPRGLDPDFRREVLEHAGEFFKELLALGTDPKRYKARINKPKMTDGWQLEKDLLLTADKYLRAAERPELKAEAREWLRSRAGLATRQAEVLAGARDFGDDEQIFYIDVQESRGSRGSPLFGSKRAALVREPLYPAETLRSQLFEKDEQPRAIIGCSATLTTSSSKPFGFISKQVGMTKFDECVAESPFDYSRAAFVVPRGMPDPQHPNFAAAVAEKFVDLMQYTGGRALGLFTSYRVMEVVASEVEGLPFRLLVQGRAPRMQLIKQFKEDETSVLLGTESFWTGVDVPGDSLIAVFIDKIPFDHFDDPVLDAIKERDENWFQSYYKPKAVIAFKQGFGRLIRSVEDRGVVVCCDNRITGKPYGKSFLKALPKAVDVYDSLEMVANYVAKR